MRVFITGATGLVGTPCIPLLLKQGHSVRALARSEASIKKLSEAGVTPVQASLADHGVLAREASEADAVIHLAFDHEQAFAGGPNGFADAANSNRAAVQAMCDAIVNTDKTFVNAHGLLGISGPNETDPKTGGNHNPRQLIENDLQTYATEKGIRTVNVRLAPVVHAKGWDHPFISTQIAQAKQHQSVAVIDEGNNYWQALHAPDAAELFVAALTKGPSGCQFHAFAENYQTKQISEYLSKKLNLPIKKYTATEAMQSGYGFIGMLMGMGIEASNAQTQKWTGWKPSGPTLFETIDTYTF